jgi:hypothetical protein
MVRGSPLYPQARPVIVGAASCRDAVAVSPLRDSHSTLSISLTGRERKHSQFSARAGATGSIIGPAIHLLPDCFVMRIKDDVLMFNYISEIYRFGSGSVSCEMIFEYSLYTVFWLLS